MHRVMAMQRMGMREGVKQRQLGGVIRSMHMATAMHTGTVSLQQQVLARGSAQGIHLHHTQRPLQRIQARQISASWWLRS